MVERFDKDGVHSTRFKIEGKYGNVVVKIGRIVKKGAEKLAGNPVLPLVSIV